MAAAATTIEAVICSTDDGKFEEVANNLKDKLGIFGLRHVHQVSDARSMHDGYNRGANCTNSDWLIFCHDDIRILKLNHDTIKIALREADVFGVCGTNLLQGPNWYDSDPLYHHGSVFAPTASRGSFEHQIFGLRRKIVHGCQALDGLFIACRSEVWRHLHFSSDYSGFTLYDIDFCYRAFLHKYRLSIVTDLFLFHQSHVSNFSTEKLEAWRRNEDIFVNKFNFRVRGERYVKHQTIVVDQLPIDG